MKRLSMRKIREALRLSFEGLSTREMALSLAIGRTTVNGGAILGHGSGGIVLSRAA